MTYLEIEKLVNNFQTESKRGFSNEEIDELIKYIPNMNIEKFESSLMGITCAVEKNKPRIYHCDIIKAIKCGLENRELNICEFD